MAEHLNAFVFGLLPWGLNQTDWAALILRVGVGLPFFVSGMNKALCPVCHGWLLANLTRSKLPCPIFLCWWLAGWEAVGGLMVLLGLFSSAAAFVLFVVCVVAFMVSWRRKLEAKKPAHFFDAVTEVGFQFDLLLIWMLLSLMATGPGVLSLDYLLWPLLSAA